MIWKDGDGWLDPAPRDRLKDGESSDMVLGKPSVVVGVEADVGTRADWADWWPRPVSLLNPPSILVHICLASASYSPESTGLTLEQVQIVQWTMASAPFHPISLSAVLRILHATAQAVDWAHKHDGIVNTLNDQGRYEEAKNLRMATVMNEPAKGGPLGVMAWTGPGIWTDAVLS